jgi:hypothetical protein
VDKRLGLAEGVGAQTLAESGSQHNNVHRDAVGSAEV